MEYIKREDVLDYINNYIMKNRIADSYKELKLFCAVEGINTTKHGIKTYMRNKAIEDCVDLFVISSKSVVTFGEVDENLQQATTLKYKFNREDLQYFNDLFKIYTTKCLKICNIISMIRGKRIVDEELMDELDITINETEILKRDVDRLLIPLIHNYCLALDTKFNAEQMETYFKLNVSRILEGESSVIDDRYLPSIYLQDYFGDYTDQNQFIALTDKQKEDIENYTIEKYTQNYISD